MLRYFIVHKKEQKRTLPLIYSNIRENIVSSEIYKENLSKKTFIEFFI